MRPKVVIIGAGATGLSLAYLLSRTGHAVEIYEGSDRVGGLLNTFEVAPGQRLEHFYHHFFTHDAEINWLLQELDLQQDVIFRASSMGILANGKIYPFNSVRDLLGFKAIGFWGRFRFGLSSALLAYRKKYSDEQTSALAWFRKHAGRAATESIWRPMMEGKFGNAAGEIPVAWMAGRLRQRLLSRKSGVEQLGYLRGSLQRLTDTLVDRLRSQGVRLHVNRKVVGMQVNGEGRKQIAFQDGSQISTDQVVFTIPTKPLVPLFAPLASSYAQQLDSIEYLGAICSVLSLKQKLSDIYWTNITDSQCDFAGVIEQTNLVSADEYRGQNLVYLSKYLSQNDPLWQVSDAELLRRQLTQLEGIYHKPISSDLTKSWVFRTRVAAPLTDQGFSDRVPEFRSPIPNVFVASMCHLYPEERSVNNSIRIAAELAAEMGVHEASNLVPRGISSAGAIGRGTLAPDQRKAA